MALGLEVLPIWLVRADEGSSRRFAAMHMAASGPSLTRPGGHRPGPVAGEDPPQAESEQQ